MKSKGSVEKHFDNLASSYDSYKVRQKYYYDYLKTFLSSLIPKGSEVLEVGCGTGDLIAHLKPKKGFGYDISSKMIDIAKTKHKSVDFSTKWPKRKFKYIFMSDVIEHLEYPEETFYKISRLMNKNSVFICTMANPKVESILIMAEKLRLKMPEGEHKRISFDEVTRLLKRSGMKPVEHDFRLLIPVYIPVFTFLANKYLEKFLRKFAFIEYFVAVRT